MDLSPVYQWGPSTLIHLSWASLFQAILLTRKDGQRAVVVSAKKFLSTLVVTARHLNDFYCFFQDFTFDVINFKYTRRPITAATSKSLNA
jgi:hypothetical protein